MSGRVLVGTCNWSDHQAFYPKGLPATSRLAYYARFFSLVEVDSTFYGIPPPNRTANWAGSTPDRFLFNVKAYRSMTYHERKGGVPRDPTEDEVSQFAECLAPLRASGKLRAVHYQFPPWFGWSPLDLDRLSRLRDRHPDDLLVVEFRNRSWTEPERWLQVVDLLRESQIALCIVDEPQLGTGSFPRLTEVTDPRLAVVRYHGRNAHSWYVQGKSSGDRFNYLYNREELAQWLPDVHRLSEQAEEVHLLFNNNRSNYAVLNGLEMAELLGQDLPGGRHARLGEIEPEVAEPPLPLEPGD
ncbi:MAG: DUF72 domain-containing protein [Candidatus Dormiibacterota bacterium]